MKDGCVHLDRMFISTHDQQLQRLMKRDNISEVASLQKMHSQLPLSAKCKKADMIIDNSKSLDETRIQAKQLIEKMQYISAGRRNMRWIGLGTCVLFVCFVLWVYT